MWRLTPWVFLVKREQYTELREQTQKGGSLMFGTQGWLKWALHGH
jgi:hypothetical protein